MQDNIHPAANEIDFETVEKGDVIEWSENFTSGEKEFRAKVVEIETRHEPAELTRPAFDKVNLVLNVTAGDIENIDPAANTDENGNLKTTFVYSEG